MRAWCGKMEHRSHYTWLEKNLQEFFARAGVKDTNNGIIVAHGDKCYSYQDIWEQAGVPFEHGVAIYFLTYISPFRTEVRETVDGWTDPSKWVIQNYARFAKYFEGLDW